MLEYDATLVEREDISPNLAIFRIRPDLPPTTSWFIPGQYMVIGLNNTEQPQLGYVSRPLSLASSPHSSSLFEFYVRYAERPTSLNPLTHLLWKIKPGDRLYAKPKSTGKFTLHHTIGTDDKRTKIFVAAGTGLAPFISMISERAYQRPNHHYLADIAIIHGASYPEELGYRARLETLSREQGLIYIPTVSRPRKRSNWTGMTGRAEDLFIPGRIDDLESKIGLAPGKLTSSNCVVFICGLRGTIASTIERLLSRGFVPERRSIAKALGFGRDAKPSLFFEQFDDTPIINIRDLEEMERLRAVIARSHTN